jgi:hypothetical protein
MKGFGTFGLLYGLCVLSQLSSAQDIHNVAIGEWTPEYTLANKELKYFSLVIDDSYVPGQDLVIKVVPPPDTNGDPDVYISKVIIIIVLIQIDKHYAF